MRRRSMVLLSAASVALVTVGIACSGGSPTQPSGTIPSQVADGKPCVEATGVPVATTPPGTDASGGTTPPGTIDKPQVSMPVGAPPTELQITDLKVGTGAEVKAGDTVTAHYVGISCSSGKQFDSSYDRGEPETFALAQVIPGWGKGLVGMKEGGRRQLVVPPGQAYGDKPTSPDILPGETLVFVVDLIKTETPPPTTTTTAAASESPSTTAPQASTSSTTTTTKAP
jgi:peptidylprolyl isomerase